MRLRDRKVPTHPAYVNMYNTRFLCSIISLLALSVGTACGDSSAAPKETPQGDVNVFWSYVDATTRVTASFLDNDAGCTVEESGACRSVTCPAPVRSLSVGTIHVRAEAPAVALDVALLDGGYGGRYDKSRVPDGSVPKVGARMRVSVDGSSSVPTFDAELAYPEHLVLTDPPASDPTAPYVGSAISVRIPQTVTAVLRWTGGAPDVRFRLEGHSVESGVLTGPLRSVVCEAPSTDGVIEISTAMIEGMSLNGYTVAERRIAVGKWPITVRLAGEVLVRSGPSGDTYFAVSFGR